MKKNIGRHIDSHVGNEIEKCTSRNQKGSQLEWFDIKYSMNAYMSQKSVSIDPTTVVFFEI